jgi:hypothetical protein
MCRAAEGNLVRALEEAEFSKQRPVSCCMESIVRQEARRWGVLLDIRLETLIVRQMQGLHCFHLEELSARGRSGQRAPRKPT